MASSPPALPSPPPPRTRAKGNEYKTAKDLASYDADIAAAFAWAAASYLVVLNVVIIKKSEVRGGSLKSELKPAKVLELRVARNELHGAVAKLARHLL